jgi:hypothetical protein
MQELVSKKYEGNYHAYFDFCFSKLRQACRKYKLNLPRHLQSNPLAEELCGIVLVFSKYDELSKRDIKKFVLAMEEKAVGSERRFFEAFNSIEKLRDDIYKISP